MEFIIILLLLILNGIFAMYEIALVSSSKARLETLVGKGNKRAKGVLKQLEEPEKFLSTIQIGITLIGIVSGAYGGATIADDVEPLFALIPGVAAYAKTLAMITVVAIITYLSLIIGELVPKSIALNNPERWATMLSPFMIVLTKISYPFVCLLSASTKLMNKLIGLNSGDIQQRAVGQRKGSQIADYRLKIQQRFQSSLGNFSLIGRIGSVPNRIFKYVTLNNCRSHRIIPPTSDIRLI